MADFDEQGGDHAADRAFDDLRAEVHVMRRAVEGLPAVLAGLKAPDYGLTLGNMAKAIQSLEKRFTIIEDLPGLRLPPDQYGALVAHSGSNVLHEVVRPLRGDIEAIRRERERLMDLVGSVENRRQQTRRRWQALAIGLAVGLVLFPLAAALLPGGSYLTALATGRLDRWKAGVSLLQLSDPDSAAAAARATTAYQANAEAFAKCEAQANRQGKEQTCEIKISPDRPPEPAAARPMQ